MSAVIRKIERNFSFKKSDSIPNLKVDPKESLEKVHVSFRGKGKTTFPHNDIKRGKSASDIRLPDSQERILNLREQCIEPEKCTRTSKFTKRYLKLKLAKIFKSGPKVVDYSKVSDLRPGYEYYANSKSQNDLSIKVLTAEEMENEALRNLSFTAAMMTKSSEGLDASLGDEASLDHTKQIPSSTLRFWKRPSEEKEKAISRRTYENIHGSNEVLLRINPMSENKKILSELSLFFDDGNCQQDIAKVSPSDIRSPAVPGLSDKAIYRYRYISRRDKSLSLAYDPENVGCSNKVEMRASQSSSNMTTLLRSNSIAQYLNRDYKRAFISNAQSSPSLRGRGTNKDQLYLDLSRTAPSNGDFYNVSAASIMPPPYDRNLNKRFVKLRHSTTKPAPFSLEQDATLKSKHSNNTLNENPPKPPPRNDSLIRSFELICKSLTTSIVQPRGDSFKMFKSQRDYENWLQNLPYNNPEKITALLKMRSKAARRQCLSELIDVHVVGLDGDKARRHSWPLEAVSSTSFDYESNRRTSSLSRVKIRKEAKEPSVNVDSPSLCNYSRLYSLRKVEVGRSHKQAQQKLPTNDPSSHTLVRSPPSTSRFRRPYSKYRYKQIVSVNPVNHVYPLNPLMTQSCLESSVHSLI